MLTARAAHGARLSTPSAPPVPRSCSFVTCRHGRVVAYVAASSQLAAPPRPARARPNPRRNVSGASPPTELPACLGGTRQRFGPPLAALIGDPSGVELRECTRCSVAPARAVAIGQGGGLGHRVVIQMPAAPPVEDPVLLVDAPRAPQKHGRPQVGRVHQRGRGVARRPCPGGWTARGSSGSRVSSTTTTPTMMSRCWRIGIWVAHRGSCRCACPR